jgi:hypothetical protein
LDNPDNRVLLAFFFIFSEMWVAEFFSLNFDVPRAREGNWPEGRRRWFESRRARNKAERGKTTTSG